MKMLTEQRLRELLERAYDKAIDNKTSVIYGAFVGDPLNAELLRAECIDNLIYISDRDEVAQQGADAFSYAVTKPVWVGVDLGVSADEKSIIAAIAIPAPEGELRTAALQAIAALERTAHTTDAERFAAADALRAALAAQPQPRTDTDDKALTQALEERDAASDYIDALLDEVLGADRHEWTSAYGHADAMAEVRERMASLEAAAPAQCAAEGDELPPLPKHLVAIDMGDDNTFGALQDHAWNSDYAHELKLDAPLFTAGQMHDYARSALASKVQPKGTAAPCAWRALDGHGLPQTDWIDGAPGPDTKSAWVGGRIELAYTHPAVGTQLPLPVLQALRFYARGDHYHLDPEQDDGFDSVSGEPDNWLCSEREDDTTMFENGGIARRVLLGQPLNWIDGDDDEQPEPVEGEVFSAAIELAAVQAPAPGEPTELEQRKRDYARALDAIKGHVEYISLLEQKLRELQSFKDGVELHQRGGSNSWYWLDDRENYLETMVASLPVVIRAEQLRELLTASQAPAVGAGYKLLEDGKTMIPADWTPLRLEWEAGYPEDVACGPVRAMERLKRWLDAYFVLIQQRMAPAAGLSLTQEPKYTVNGHAIVNRASGAEIPADEPVFILRASDKRAASIIGEYAEMCNDPVHAQIVSDRFCEFGDWADAHPERMKEPDTAPANFDVPVQAKGKLPAALEGAPIVQAIRVWIESHKARHGGASPTDDEVIEAAHQDPPFSQPL